MAEGTTGDGSGADEAAPGWDAIDAALAVIHGDPAAVVTFRPGDADGHRGRLRAHRHPHGQGLQDVLEQVPPRRGSHLLPSWPRLVVHVLATEMRDQDGTGVEVIR